MDPDAELKKQIDLLRESLIVLSMMENKSSQRIQSHEERLLEQEKLTAKHTQWLLDHEMAMQRSAELMVQINDKLNVLVAVVDDMIRGKHQ